MDNKQEQQKRCPGTTGRGCPFDGIKNGRYQCTKCETLKRTLRKERQEREKQAHQNENGPDNNNRLTVTNDGDVMQSVHNGTATCNFTIIL